MRVLLVALLLLAGCTSAMPTAKPLTAETLNASLTASGLPVANVTTFTAETDVNHLLGRPNQYVAKVNWDDTRLDTQQNDLTVEVFTSVADLQARQKYIDALGKGSPLFAQYIVPNEPRLALMRLPHQLTPEQAEAYKAWFAAL